MPFLTAHAGTQTQAQLKEKNADPIGVPVHYFNFG